MPYMAYMPPPGTDVRPTNPMLPNPELARQYPQPWGDQVAVRMPGDPQPLAPTANRQSMHQEQADDVIPVIVPKQKRQRQRRSPIQRRKVMPEVMTQPHPPSPPPIPMPVPMPSFAQPPAAAQLGKSHPWKPDEASPKPRELRHNIELELQLCARVGTFDTCCLNGYPVMRDLGPR